MSLIWPILKRAIKHPKRLAVIDDQREYTYGKLVGGAFFLADAIARTTEKKHVGLMLPTSGAFPMALLGAWLADRVAVPLNFLLNKDELAYVIKDSGIDTIFTVRRLLDHIGGEEIVPKGVKIIYVEELKFTGIPPLRWPPSPADNELAALLYTSGTSGKPKGVMLTHGNLTANVEGVIKHAGLTGDLVFMGVLPQFHSFGLTGLTLLPLVMGSRIIYNLQFLPKRIVKLIKEHKPSLILAVPSMYGALLSVKGATAEDFASLQFAVSGGEPLPQATFDAFRDRFNVKLLEGYGLTETAPITNWSTPACNRLHSVGRALPSVNIRVVDDQDRALPADKEGEILISGPNVMMGYHNLPEQTASVFVDLPTDEAVDPKGPGAAGAAKTRFFRSGDIGRVDPEGYLFITGRKKEMLIIAGENVFPREIEEVLNQHDSVRDSAVIGKMDDLRGEVPVAFVELVEGGEFDETALRAWCRDRLAGYKVPREIRHIEALPRNPTGKIMRRALKA